MDEYVGGRLVGKKMIGSGGNTSCNYNFYITKLKDNCAQKMSYYFTDRFNRLGPPFVNGIATTGFGKAARIDKAEVPRLIAKFPNGSCRIKTLQLQQKSIMV